jgi:hypothetical protein
LGVSIVGIEVAALTRAARSVQESITTSDVCWNGWCGAETAIGGDTITAALLVDQHDHPDTDCAGVAEEWCAVNPAWATLAFAILVWARKPTNLSSHAATFSERSLQVCANAW